MAVRTKRHRNGTFGTRRLVASFATVENDTLTLTALVASDDGRTIIRKQQSGLASDADSIGLAVAEALLDGGARDLLAGSST